MLNYFWGKGPKGPEMGQEEKGKADDNNTSGSPAADPAEELKSAANEAFKGMNGSLSFDILS